MDDLLALDGGAAARKWKRRRAKLKAYIELIQRRRIAQEAREARWDREQRRKARVARIEKPEREEFLKRRKAEGYRNPRLPYKDLKGRRFGRLVVVKPGGHNPSGSKRWWVKCDCGSPIKEVSGTNLQQGILRSCGCLLGNQTGKERKRKRAAKAKIARRQIRNALCRWKHALCNNAGDAKMIRRLRAIADWAEARMAVSSNPRLRQLPTMKDVVNRAAKYRNRYLEKLRLKISTARRAK